MIRRYPSLFLLIFIVSGIVLADQCHPPSWLILSICLFLCLGGFVSLSSSRGPLTIILFCLSLLCFSAFQFAIRYYDTGPNHLAGFVTSSQRYHVFGTVADWPDLKADRTEIRVSLDSIGTTTNRRVSGAILLRVTGTTTALQRGDRLEFYGQIYPVRGVSLFDSFDYRRYLNMRGVFGVVYLPTLLDVRLDRRNRYGVLSAVDKLRNAIRKVLYANLSPSSAALACGFLIGETKDIPADIYRRFRDSGTLHLLAVSGSNVALVLLFFVVLFRPLAMSPTRRSLILLAVIVIFALLSYGEPSVVRASLMAALVIMAGLLQRRHNLNNVIAAAAVLILLFEPGQLFDIGFQLSFSIAWGLIFITPRVADYFRLVHNRRWYRWLVFPFVVSLVAQVCSMGLIAFHFGRVPIISPLANLLIVPLVSLAVVGILVVLAAYLVLPLLAVLAGSWLNVLLELILRLVRVLGSEDLPTLKLTDMPLWLTISYYLLLFLATWSLSCKSARRLIAVVLLLGINSVLAVRVFGSRPSPFEARITIFGVPGGVVTVVTRPGAASADLVIAGMAARTYPVDDRIIRPLLGELGVTGLSTVFVLSADFDAIDDILRLSSFFSSQRLLVDKRLEPSFVDVIRGGPPNWQKIPYATFESKGSPPAGEGRSYSPTASGLLLASNGRCILVCDRIMPCHFEAGKVTAGTTLVVAQAWRMSYGDCIRLRESGFENIVCSKIAQVRYDFDDLGAEPESGVLPEGVYDLSLQGPLRLKL